MGIIHRATLTPRKDEIVTGWLSTQDWAEGLGELTKIGSYRFDDPAGEVGVEFLLYTDGDAVVHVPLSYRSAPLEGVEVVTTAEHSVLGTRYVYDALADPVAVQALLTAILTGASQAEMVVEQTGETLPVKVFAKGSGTLEADDVPTVDAIERELDGPQVVILTAGTRIGVTRLVGAGDFGYAETLLVSWPEGHGLLAGASPLAPMVEPEES